MDLKLYYIDKTFAVKDLDQNGSAEVWLMYKNACHSDVSPVPTKIIMCEASKKYVLGGKSKVRISEPNLRAVPLRMTKASGRATFFLDSTQKTSGQRTNLKKASIKCTTTSKPDAKIIYSLALCKSNNKHSKSETFNLSHWSIVSLQVSYVRFGVRLKWGKRNKAIKLFKINE